MLTIMLVNFNQQNILSSGISILLYFSTYSPFFYLKPILKDINSLQLYLFPAFHSLKKLFTESWQNAKFFTLTHDTTMNKSEINFNNFGNSKPDLKLTSSG